MGISFSEGPMPMEVLGERHLFKSRPNGEERQRIYKK